MNEGVLLRQVLLWSLPTSLKLKRQGKTALTITNSLFFSSLYRLDQGNSYIERMYSEDVFLGCISKPKWVALSCKTFTFKYFFSDPKCAEHLSILLDATSSYKEVGICVEFTCWFFLGFVSYHQIFTFLFWLSITNYHFIFLHLFKISFP